MKKSRSASKKSNVIGLVRLFLCLGFTEIGSTNGGQVAGKHVGDGGVPGISGTFVDC